MKCPFCEKGTLKETKVKEIMFGVNLGEFPAQKCSNCGETFTSEETTTLIEKKAKENGIWGLEKKTKIAKSGNSLAVRIPKQLAQFLELQEGKDAYIYPENNRLIIETNMVREKEKWYGSKHKQKNRS